MKINPIKDGASRTNLVLLELILNLFLFLLCAVVCVSLIFYARNLSQESSRLTDAVYVAQTAAETWRSGNLSQNSYTDEATGLDVSVSENGEAVNIEIYFEDDMIYSLEGVHALEKE